MKKKKLDPGIKFFLLFWVALFLGLFLAGLTNQFLVSPLSMIAWLVYFLWDIRLTPSEKKQRKIILELWQACDGFISEAGDLERAYKSVLAQEPVFSSPDASESMKEAYNIIKEQIELNIQSATLYMKSCVPDSYISRKHMEDIVDNTDLMLGKLAKLAELNYKVDHQTTVDSSEDVAYVDDLIKALKEMCADD